VQFPSHGSSEASILMQKFKCSKWRW